MEYLGKGKKQDLWNIAVARCIPVKDNFAIIAINDAVL